MKELFSVDGPYARVMNWLWNMLVISVLWILCSLPVVTIGAASTAAYYAAAKAVRRHAGTTAKEFFSAFRLNLVQGTVLTVLFGLVTGVLVMECVYLYSDPGVPLSMLYLFYFLTAAVLACAMYLWCCLSRFARGSFALIRMAVVLTFRHITTSILLLLLLAALLIGVYLMPWGILIFPGVTVYLQTFPVERILLRYSPKPAEDSEEAQKWYYQ